jgi:hypothetical protein
MAAEAREIELQTAVTEQRLAEVSLHLSLSLTLYVSLFLSIYLSLSLSFPFFSRTSIYL